MKLTHVSVRNYKSLHDAQSDLSNFVCTIGENNAGKSSLLQSLLLFINGTKISKAEYYDPEAEIFITVSLKGVTDEVLSKLTEDHRRDLTPHIRNEELVLVRRYSTDGSSKLRVVTQIPKELRFRSDEINKAFEGKKNKEIGETLKTFYPDVASNDIADSTTTQKAAKELIQAFVSSLNEDQLVMDDIPLPTGIDKLLSQIKNMLMAYLKEHLF